jgi:ubiquitin-protein ligase E3 A
LLSAQLFDISSGMWSDRFDEERITWFNPDCFWNDEGYYMVGILVGLAVYNGVLLDVHFPPAIFRKLLGLPLGLEDMVDSRLRKSLEHLLNYEGDDVEDIFCLSFSLKWMDLGTERIVELKPGGDSISVTSENKEEYVKMYVKWHLEESIHAQYDGFERGFMKIMENATLDFLSPEELELLVVGSPELDFDALEENTTYEGYEKDDAVIQHLWSFLKHAEDDTKLMFLKFTTGSSRAPIGGLGKLRFKIQKNGDNTSQLPTSHTCFNTLLLPNYGDNFDQVADRMGRAVLECEGFGLQ